MFSPQPAPTVVLVASLLLACPPAHGQGSRADYERAAALSSLGSGAVLNDSVHPEWIDEGARLWYRREPAGGRAEYVLVDCETGERSPLFDPASLARAVHDTDGRELDPERLPISLVAVEGEHVFLLLDSGTEVYCYNLELEVASSVPVGEAAPLHLEPQARVRRSRSGRGDTAVLFGNGLDETLSLFWVDEEGERRAYGEVAPGAVSRQDTFARHAWVLVDSAGKDRGAFVAETQTKVAWMDSNTPAPGTVALRGERRDGRDTDRRDGPRIRVYIRDHDLWIDDPELDEDVALTTDGIEADGYGGSRWMSPDRTKVVVMRTVAGDEREVHYVEAAPRDQLQPKLHSYSYRKPGDRVPVERPLMFDLESRKEIPIDDALFENPWRIGNPRWAEDSSRFMFLFNERGHQILRIIAVDAESGEARTIVDETSSTFVDYSQKQEIHYLDETEEILWSSERDGWNHLYLYDAKTGRVKNQVTKGPWIVREVDRVDEEARQVWFRAGGIHPNQDPYHVHYCRVDLDGSDLVVLTDGDGTHTIWDSPDERFFIDRYSRVDLPPVIELRRAADGSLVRELERADWTALLETGWRPPKRFVAKGRDGKTDIWGLLRYPTNHDPERSYPVIEAIYAGPHGAHVPKSFRRYVPHDAVAELGFVVVQVDGMGTNYRSKAFHDVCWKNIGDGGFPDRIAWMRAAAEEDPSLDLSHVGIYGGSAGGQNALRALLAHGDFYAAAAADCGCHDNRMDKIWWNEAWMGWPIGPHYEEQSNVTQAHKLEGDLLLMVGAMDENVDPASTMQVVQALIDADKDFELIVFPRGGHGAGGSAYGRRRQQDFFVRSLLGVEPRWE